MVGADASSELSPGNRNFGLDVAMFFKFDEPVLASPIRIEEASKRSMIPSGLIRTPCRNGDMVAVPPAFSQTSGETVVSINCISSLKFANDAPPRGWIGSFSLEEGAMLLSGVFG
jgi:hypothetical protein